MIERSAVVRPGLLASPTAHQSAFLLAPLARAALTVVLHAGQIVLLDRVHHPAARVIATQDTAILLTAVRGTVIPVTATRGNAFPPHRAIRLAVPVTNLKAFYFR